MEQRNLILAIVISIGILLAFQFFIEMPRLQRQQAEQQQRAQTEQTTTPPSGETAQTQGTAPSAPSATGEAAPTLLDREAALAQSPRVAIRSSRLTGSIALKGARIDDLVLANYTVDVTPGSPHVVLLTPQGAKDGYWADFGWVAQGDAVTMPDASTLWQADSDALTPERPLTLTWDNGQGLRFSQIFTLDRDYMFTIKQRVENTGTATATLYPYGIISRFGKPHTLGFFILHEGPIAVFNGTLEEADYSDLQDSGILNYKSTGGWLGMTDKYWLVALMPDQKRAIDANFAHGQQTDIYQAAHRGGGMTLAPGATIENEGRLFAGAKEVRLLDRYEAELGIPLLDRAVDFSGYLGYFCYLIAKPLFYVLDYIYRQVGNFGIAILLLTVLVKGIFFPLANKSYRAMSKMKALAPEMTSLRERFKDDRQKLNQEMMALYKREKVNPAAGCLPIIIQIPVFIALYQVLFVTIEMRHAPFFGWIQDLSSPDPTSVLNLFGLLPYAVPNLGPLQILSIGVWPLVMGLTMYLQQKLNPAPPDPVQARIFMMLPIIFTFMLAHFPAGLVIYWAWNNTLSIAQQRAIMWRMGVKA